MEYGKVKEEKEKEHDDNIERLDNFNRNDGLLTRFT